MAQSELWVKELDYGYLVQEWDYSEDEGGRADIEHAHEDIGAVAWHMLTWLGFTEESVEDAVRCLREVAGV